MTERRFEVLPETCSLCSKLAEWNPIVSTWPLEGRVEEPTRYVIDFPICNEHRLSLKKTDIVNDQVWETIRAYCFEKQEAIPNRLTAKIQYRKIKKEVVFH